MAEQIEVKDLHAPSSIQHFFDLQPRKLKNKKIQKPILSRREERKSIPILPLQIQVLRRQKVRIMKQLSEVKMRLIVPFIPKRVIQYAYLVLFRKACLPVIWRAMESLKSTLLFTYSFLLDCVLTCPLQLPFPHPASRKWVLLLTSSCPLISAKKDSLPLRTEAAKQDVKGPALRRSTCSSPFPTPAWEWSRVAPSPGKALMLAQGTQSSDAGTRGHEIGAGNAGP